MKQEFQANVEKLFQTMVPVGDTGGYDIDKLVTILRRRATRPIRVDASEDRVRLTYYNVTIVIARNLASMQIVYNSDYQLTLRHVACADPYRLADFIAALERDIPQWKHIWMAHDRLCREKALIAQKVKNVLHDIRHRWTRGNTSISPQEREECRIHFFNLKAHELMLAHDNPFWQNRKTEAEIIEQCLLYHITPPVERWLEEWTSFSDVCSNIAEERQRIREEKEHAAQKAHHLVHLKDLKMYALLNTIEFHPSIIMDVAYVFNIYPGVADPLRNGAYYVTLQFEDALVEFKLKYYQVDAVLYPLVDSCRQLNDLWPELQEALTIDRQKHGCLYLCANEAHGLAYSSSKSASYSNYIYITDEQFGLKDISKTPLPSTYETPLASTPILNRMNSIIGKFYQQLRATPE